MVCEVGAVDVLNVNQEGLWQYDLPGWCCSGCIVGRQGEWVVSGCVTQGDFKLAVLMCHRCRWGDAGSSGCISRVGGVIRQWGLRAFKPRASRACNTWLRIVRFCPCEIPSCSSTMAPGRRFRTIRFTALSGSQCLPSKPRALQRYGPDRIDVMARPPMGWSSQPLSGTSVVGSQ